MGLTQKLGTIPLAVFTDSSNNVGIGGAANASYKLQVTGTTNLTGALTALTLYSNAGIGLSLSGQFTGGGGYTGINGQALGIDIRPNSGGIFNLNFSSTTNRTFTFPDASGTIALTSNLSSYVPYTGATTNVDLGANNLTSQHLIANGLTGVSGTLQLKQNTSYAYSNGYTSFYTTGNNFAITAVNSTGTTLYNAIFDLSASTSSRTFTLPTTSGTLVLGTGTTNYLPKFTGASTIGDSLVYSNATGVGIGTTSPSFPLHIATVGGDAVALYLSGDGSGNSAIKGGGGNLDLWSPGGDVTLRYNNASSVKTIGLVVKNSSGNVGIGTTTPATLLSVNGSARLIGTATSSVSLGFGTDNGVSGWSIGNGIIDNTHNFRIYDNTNATTPLTISGSGNLLVGTTTDAGNLVQLKNASAIGWANSNSWTWGLYKVTNDLYIKYTSGGDISAGTTALQFTGGTGAATFSSSVSSSTTISSRTSVPNVGTNGSPYFEDAFNLGQSNNLCKIQYGNSFIDNNGTWMRFIVNGSAAQNTPITALTLRYDGAATFSSSVQTGGNIRTLMTGTTDVPSIYSENNVGSLTQIRTFGTSAAGTLFGVTRAGWSSIDTNNGLGLLFGTTDNAPIVIGTGNTERMRITSGGNVLIGTTSDSGYRVVASLSSGGGFRSLSAGSGDAGFLSDSTGIGYHYYAYSGAAKFYVVNGGQIYSTSTSISAISDIRHKENIRPIETGINEIMMLKPSRFDWKEGKGTGKKDVAGFIAQDIEEVFPDLVDEWKEQMDAEETFKSIRMSDLIPTLVKAIQEQQEIINQLSAKVTALENR